MSSTETIIKSLRSMGEGGFTKLITSYAKTVHPTLTREQAFTKIFTANDDEGKAIRCAWLISKGQVVTGESSDDDDARDNDDDSDAMEELNALAEAERRRKPSLSKAQAFAKVYSENHELAVKERLQNRPR
jgi:hypothetical protein